MHMADVSENPKTILVVDSTPTVLDAIVAILKTAKFNVLTANSGHEALEVATNHPGPIHLLLADVQMPDMTGPDLGDILHAPRPNIRIMFMSETLS